MKIYKRIRFSRLSQRTVGNEIHPCGVGEIACGGEIALRAVKSPRRRWVDFISPNASAFDFT